MARSCRVRLSVLHGGRQELGAAGLTKRPTSCMLVLPGSTDAADEESVEYRAAFGEVVQKVKTVQIIF